MRRLEPLGYVEAADAHVENAKRQILQTSDRGDEAGVVGSRSDRQIEIAVRRQEFHQLGVARQLVTALRYTSEPLEIRRIETEAGREFCRPWLEQHPQSIDVLHVLEGERSDAQAALIRFVDQA